MKFEKFHYLVTFLSILFFNLIPSLFFANELLYTVPILIFTSFIGYKLSENIILNSLDISLNFNLVFYLFLLFLIFESFYSFSDFFSPNKTAVFNYLRYQISAPKGFFDIIRLIIRNLFLISILINTNQHKYVSFFYILIFAFVVSGISRSTFIIYIAIAFFTILDFNLDLKSVFIFIILFFIFNFISYLREDTSVLGNTFFTAIGYPIINLKELSRSNLHGFSSDFFMQFLIKPFPGFLFEPFGGKPIFSFNVTLTEMLKNRVISNDNPISVFTSAGALLFYKPLIITIIIFILIYIEIGLFIKYIKNYKGLLLYTFISIFILHRSNLLDIISFITSIFYSILIIKIITKIKF